MIKEDIIDNSNYLILNNYKKVIYVFVINKTFEYLKSVCINQDKYDVEVTRLEIESFLEIIDRMNPDITTKSLFLIFLSETCRTLDPLFSSKLILDAFVMKPDLMRNIFSTHLKNSQYNPKIINQQKEIEKCLICGGDGTPFHNAPCYRMVDYVEDFLPFKLWYKCEGCGNLFTKYFPLKFFDRENPMKVIIPSKDDSCNLKKISYTSYKQLGEDLKRIRKLLWWTKYFRSWNWKWRAGCYST